jgi:hypothetical protein
MDITLPFLISLVGIIADYLTTRIGLSLGFYETHLQYQPAYALIIFWSTLTLLALVLPKGKFWGKTKNAVLVLVAFLGSINNTLVIFGFFSGLKI